MSICKINSDLFVNPSHILKIYTEITSDKTNPHNVVMEFNSPYITNVNQSVRGFYRVYSSLQNNVWKFNSAQEAEKYLDKLHDIIKKCK